MQMSEFGQQESLQRQKQVFICVWWLSAFILGRELKKMRRAHLPASEELTGINIRAAFFHRVKLITGIHNIQFLYNRISGAANCITAPTLT